MYSRSNVGILLQFQMNYRRFSLNLIGIGGVAAAADGGWMNDTITNRERSASQRIAKAERIGRCYSNGAV